MSGVSARRYGDVLVEAYGKCGLEPTWSPTGWKADRGKGETHPSWANFTLCRPMRKKNVEPASPGKHTAQGPRWDLNSIH